MMRLSGFKKFNIYSNVLEWDELTQVLAQYPKAEFEVYVRAPSSAGLSLIPDVRYTLKNRRGRIVYSFNFAERVYKWKNEEIYLTRHEEVALYAHMHCKADIYWTVALKTLRERLGKDFMADEKELELDCKICD